MTERVQIGDAVLYCADCLEVLPTLAQVDAVIADPPFFCPATHYQSRVKWQRKWADMSILTTWWSVVCDELVRVTSQSGHVLTFCNADSYAAFYPAMYERFDKLVSLVWDKQRPGLGRVWRHQHELIIAARKDGAFCPDDGICRGDVLGYKASPSRDREHPVEKPAEMLAELVRAICPIGATVLDPFMGSGTTGVACAQTGRRFIGIEIDPKYFEIACKRIEAAQAQLRLPLAESKAAP